MGRRFAASLGLLLVLVWLGPVHGVGRVGPDRVAEVVDAMKANDLLVANEGEAILAAASKARVGQPAVGMKRIPIVGGKTVKQTTSKPAAAKIVAPAKFCAVALFGKAKKLAKRLFRR